MDSDWILYGPEMDKTMGMKNYLTMSLYRDTGRYSSGVVFCELFLIEDGGALDLAHYNGLYILMEKVKRDKARVDVNKHKEEDISGELMRLLWNMSFVQQLHVKSTPVSLLYTSQLLVAIIHECSGSWNV